MQSRIPQAISPSHTTSVADNTPMASHTIGYSFRSRPDTRECYQEPSIYTLDITSHRD